MAAKRLLSMSVFTRNGFAAAAGLLAMALGACQGNLGTGAGGGLSLPQTPAYGQPQTGGAPQAQSRQRVLEGAVTLSAGIDAIPLPALDGFSATLVLGTPAPKPSASSAASAAATTVPGRAGARGHAGSARVAAPSPSAAPSVSPQSSSQPSVAPTASPSPDAQRSDAAAARKVETKTTVYPDDAPAAPSPQPTGNVQTFAKRTALVRGFVLPSEDLTLYGLGALRFTLPPSEQTSERGYTVAVFEAGKKHHGKLLAFDAQPTLADNVVASSLASEPLTLKKMTGYLLMLYADELPPTPAPAAGYASPGNNPFVTPIPSGYPGGPGGPPAGPASPPPYGPATPLGPNAPPTRF